MLKFIKLKIKAQDGIILVTKKKTSLIIYIGIDHLNVQQDNYIKDFKK